MLLAYYDTQYDLSTVSGKLGHFTAWSSFLTALFSGIPYNKEKNEFDCRIWKSSCKFAHYFCKLDLFFDLNYFFTKNGPAYQEYK